MLVAVVSPVLFERAAWWLGAIAAVTMLGGFLALRRDAAAPAPQQTRSSNPTQLRSALAFAGVYVLIRIVTKGTIELGGAGLFLVAAAAAGITDMDAIAMSTAREVTDGAIAAELGTRAVLLALLVNTVFKLVVTGVLGSAQLFRVTLPTLGVAAVIALVGVFVV
jgi:uncharacterized membrane protein (DUF4010 family)